MKIIFFYSLLSWLPKAVMAAASFDVHNKGAAVKGRRRGTTPTQVAARRRRTPTEVAAGRHGADRARQGRRARSVSPQQESSPRHKRARLIPSRVNIYASRALRQCIIPVHTGIDTARGEGGVLAVGEPAGLTCCSVGGQPVPCPACHTTRRRTGGMRGGEVVTS